MTDIMRSDEHRIIRSFMRHGSPNKVEGIPRELDKSGQLEIRIDTPQANTFKVAFTDDIVPFDVAFEISVEGAEQLMLALKKMIDWRIDKVQTARIQAKESCNAEIH